MLQLFCSVNLILLVLIELLEALLSVLDVLDSRHLISIHIFHSHIIGTALFEFEPVVLLFIQIEGYVLLGGWLEVETLLAGLHLLFLRGSLHPHGDEGSGPEPVANQFSVVHGVHKLVVVGQHVGVALVLLPALGDHPDELTRRDLLPHQLVESRVLEAAPQHVDVHFCLQPVRKVGWEVGELAGETFEQGLELVDQVPGVGRRLLDLLASSVWSFSV